MPKSKNKRKVKKQLKFFPKKGSKKLGIFNMVLLGVLVVTISVWGLYQLTVS